MTSRCLSYHIGTVRKSHQCRVCGDIIEAGEIAVIYYGVDEDGFHTSYFHRLCWEYSRDWSESDWDTLNPGSVSREEIWRELEP